MFINRTNYGLFIGTDLCEAGGRRVLPSNSNSYLFEEGAIKRSLKFNYLIRVEGVVIPVYSVKVYTEDLPEELEVTVRNSTSSFVLKGDDVRVVNLAEGSDLRLEEDEVYGDGVRYRCLNPVQKVEEPGDVVFSFYPEYRVEVTLSPEEILQVATFKVNNTEYSNRFAEWFRMGTVLKVEAPESIKMGDTMYVFTGYSNGEKNNVVEFRVGGAPSSLVAEYSVRYYISAESDFGTISGEDWYNKGDKARITLDTAIVQLSPNTRYVFQGWEPLDIKDLEASFTVTKPLNLKAVWEQQHKVVAYSNYGNVSPTETWVVEGEEVRVFVEPEYVSTGFLVGKAFSHLVDQHGNVYRGNPVNIKVKEPLVLKAVWVDDYREAYGAGFALLVLVIVAVFIMRRLAEKKPSPPLPPPPPPPSPT